MEYICKYCGAKFTDKPSAKRVYCSKKCHDEAQNKKVKVYCAECGAEFSVPPSRAQKWERNFCGNDCRLAWLSKHVIDEVNVKGHSAGHKAPHLSELNKERNPMIAIVQDPELRGEYHKNEHRKIAEKTLGRKLEPSEDVHHINGIRDDNRPENLVVLDHDEHMRLHWRIAKEKGVI